MRQNKYVLNILCYIYSSNIYKGYSYYSYTKGSLLVRYIFSSTTLAHKQKNLRSEPIHPKQKKNIIGHIGWVCSCSNFYSKILKYCTCRDGHLDYLVDYRVVFGNVEDLRVLKAPNYCAFGNPKDTISTL